MVCTSRVDSIPQLLCADYHWCICKPPKCFRLLLKHPMNNSPVEDVYIARFMLLAHWCPTQKLCIYRIFPLPLILCQGNKFELASE